MVAISVETFVTKWRKPKLSEKRIYQLHFADVCALVGKDAPDGTGKDTEGRVFQFEADTKATALERRGFADVFLEGHFALEYKTPGKPLKEAYQQLLRYREQLNNPPLLVVTDFANWEIHTNFENTVAKVYRFKHDDIDRESAPDIRGNPQPNPALRWLHAMFHDPSALHPKRTKEELTLEAAERFQEIAREMRHSLHGEPNADERIAYFITKLVFCLFAEDIDLLPRNAAGDGLFSEIPVLALHTPDTFAPDIQELFQAMAHGGRVARLTVPFFNGNLFDNVRVEHLTPRALEVLIQVAKLDWASIEPSIFGTLFERSLDPLERVPLGAHYTSRKDITLVLEPVLMQPLEAEWEQVQAQAALARVDYDAAANTREQVAARDALAALRQGILTRVRTTRVLDPACGSGNFLYVSLQMLLNLERRIIHAAVWRDVQLAPESPAVHPRQLFGIEKNVIAHQLASIVVWIGWLQSRIANGIYQHPSPILTDLRGNIQHMDAILAYAADGTPTEPEWPEVEVIVGNPPFLGGKNQLEQLGEEYIKQLRAIYSGRIGGLYDLVTYWFEKGRKQIELGKAKRCGFIATNSIRDGNSRRVLEKITITGSIFIAWEDLPWVLDGAAVRFSIVGFDDGTIKKKHLNGSLVKEIYPNLKSNIDTTNILKLNQNKNLSFIGIQKNGDFEIPHSIAQTMLDEDSDNIAVLRSWVNGEDIVQNDSQMWIIDFDRRSFDEAKAFQKPFAYIEKMVKPEREQNKQKNRRNNWWKHGANASGMRDAISKLKRQIATPITSTHRIFVWLPINVLVGSTAVVIARDDDYCFGVLHSRLHEIWSLRMGSWLGKGNDPRYTPTSTFETFPFPYIPGKEPLDAPAYQAVAAAAAQLHAERSAWQTPPNRQADDLKHHTLTNLYNALEAHRTGASKIKLHTDAQAFAPRLAELHQALDEAVCAAYGWQTSILESEDAMLTALLALNLQRAGE